MSDFWWPTQTIGRPYRYEWPESRSASCNCTPPDLILVADADAYFAATLKADAWAALTPTQKSQALKSSQDALRTLRWCTDEDPVCGQDLVTNYTAAAAELALVLFSNADAVFGAGDQLPVPVVKRQKLGDLEQEYFAPGTTGALPTQAIPSDGRVGRRSPTVLRLYPWLLDLIGWWVDTSGSSAIRLVRG